LKLNHLKYNCKPTTDIGADNRLDGKIEILEAFITFECPETLFQPKKTVRLLFHGKTLNKGYSDELLRMQYTRTQCALCTSLSFPLHTCPFVTHILQALIQLKLGKNKQTSMTARPESNRGYRDEQILALLLFEPDAHRAPPCLFLPDLFSSLNESSDLVLQRGHSNTKSG
jgi:hypothetical protein